VPDMLVFPTMLERGGRNSRISGDQPYARVSRHDPRNAAGRLRARPYQAEQEPAPGTEGRFWIARLAVVFHLVEPVRAVRDDG